MSKTKKLIEESIMFAIDSLSKDIMLNANTHENMINALSIRALAEAYDAVHRRKRGDR